MSSSESVSQLILKALIHTYNKVVNGKMVLVKEHFDSRTKHDYIEKEVGDVASKKETKLPKQMPIIFASGTNDAGEIRGMRDAGIPVGTVANELYNPQARKEVENLAGTGLPVFVDSGAFSEVEEQPDGPPKVTKPIPDSEWKARIQLYIELSKKLGSQLNAVAPDQIANQQMTLWRLRQYGHLMKEVADNGSHVLVALQGGQMDRITFFKRAVEALGFSHNVVPCFPMKKAPASKESIVEFMKVVKPKRVHFLGLGIKGKNTAEILDAAQAASPETQITIDANIISGHVGVDPKTGKASASRTLTAAQHAILNWGFEDPYGETKDEDWGIHEDYTDKAASLSEWATTGQLAMIAKKAKLSENEAKMFAKHPDEFLQLQTDQSKDAAMDPAKLKAFMSDPDKYMDDMDGGDGPQWYEHPLMSSAIDDVWGERLEKLSTHARKHEAIPHAFASHPAAGQFPEAKELGEVNRLYERTFDGVDNG